MAYLFKHTPLALNVQVNMTCLVPDRQPQVCGPKRLDLKEMLQHFLDFREVVTGASSSSCRGCKRAPPPARGLREGLRRARRDDQDHPQERRQSDAKRS
jgi:hypothetical protein